MKIRQNPEFTRWVHDFMQEYPEVHNDHMRYIKIDECDEPVPSFDTYMMKKFVRWMYHHDRLSEEQMDMTIAFLEDERCPDWHAVFSHKPKHSPLSGEEA